MLQSTREELEEVFSLGTQQERLLGVITIKDHFKARRWQFVVYFTVGVSRYVGKMFNDDWMRRRGFLRKRGS
jgi:cystathionine beta-synthase